MAGGYLLGLDFGSGFIKAALVDARTRQAVALAQAPAAELTISAAQPGWAEQDPREWWAQAQAAVAQLRSAAPEALSAVRAIGLAYQMHGLVLLDAAGQPLRPAIIWCDSRAASLGAEAEAALGTQWCLRHLCNTPGNFTAAKLAWVQRHEPQLYARARWALLPGDYIAYKLTGAVATTASGLSEMTLWDYPAARPATGLLDHYGIRPERLPTLVPSFGDQGCLTAEAAAALGLSVGIPVTYRAGDQPHNALSLGVLDPGEAAATAGTSGVVFAVADTALADPRQRVNTFLHANHTAPAPRYGVLLCVNGAGSSYRWLRECLSLATAPSYQTLSALAEQAPAGADGLAFLPFGNGAERMLGNRAPGASFHGLDYNRHTPAHLARAVQEGVAFALAYGLEALRGLGLEVTRVRASAANMFLSSVFTEALAASAGVCVELQRTDSATGAALAAGYGAGLYPSLREALAVPARALVDAGAAERRDYAEHYARWRGILQRELVQGASDG